MAEGSVRIAIADDHPIFVSGLRQLLGTEPGMEVVGTATDAAATVELVATTHPDLLLLDYSMPRGGGREALRELGRRGLQVRTVILTAAIEPEQVVESLKLGAVGVLLKSAATELLFRCIRTVMQGQYWVERTATGKLVTALRHEEAARKGGSTAGVELSPREQKILAALLKGESNKVIARELGIAEQTVKNILSQLYEKFAVSSRLELALLSREKGLADP
jgi:two-component system nitrate/nitrite response regulator NarL